MLNAGIIPNFLDDWYFFGGKKPKSFTKYVDNFNRVPNCKQSALMVPMFKWELYNDPKKLHNFFKHYDQFIKRVLKIKDLERMYLITSQHFGVFSILADKDETGRKTMDVMMEDPLKSNILNLYDFQNGYGPTMVLFSNFMKIGGKELTKLLKEEYLIHTK